MQICAHFLYTDIRCRGNEERERENAGLKFREQDEERGELMIRRDVILSAHRCAGIDAKNGLAGVAARVSPA